MAEKEQIFNSNIKSTGIFNFRNFYKFCYEWLVEETGLDVMEVKYKEKLAGSEKEMEIEWEGETKFTDYFQFKTKVKFEVKHLTNVEINEGGKKINTNKGEVKVTIKSYLVRDYLGKFESNAFLKFLRATYERWIILSRIKQFESKIIGDSDEFLSQTKAFLDLEGKR